MSVKAEPPKAAPSRQTQASKQKRKKKKGKADPSDKPNQAEPAKAEEDLDQLLAELNIKLVRLSFVADRAHLAQLEPAAPPEITSLTRLTSAVPVQESASWRQ